MRRKDILKELERIIRHCWQGKGAAWVGNELEVLRFKLLAGKEGAADAKDAKAELDKIASTLGKQAAGKPKKFSDDEINRRTERIREAQRERATVMRKNGRTAPR